MTPAQRLVARNILGFLRRGGVSSANLATHYDHTLHGLVAQELVAGGFATAVELGGGRHDYRLTREAAAAVLEPGERLSLRDFPPPGHPDGSHPTKHF